MWKGFEVKVQIHPSVEGQEARKVRIYEEWPSGVVEMKWAQEPNFVTTGRKETHVQLVVPEKFAEMSWREKMQYILDNTKEGA